MNKKLKYFLFILLGILFVPTLKVQATEYTTKINEIYKWIPNTYIVKDNGTIKKYQQLTVIAKTVDNQFVYCIEMGTGINSNSTYTGIDYNQESVVKMTSEQWKRVELLAYYGYGYSDSEVDHTDIKWYSVTQYMIWQTVPNGYDIYFTDTLNGNRITKYTDEITEMEQLLSEHKVVPSFDSTTYDMVIGNTIKITDDNNVLSKWQVSSDSKVTVTKEGNSLYITANEVGNTTITLEKKDTKYSHPTIVYVESDSQDLVEVGSFDPSYATINVNIVGGKVAINKMDTDTGLSIPQGDATLEGAIYGVYKEDGTLVTTMTTDSNGYAISGYLPSLGKFLIKEITPSKGYKLDTNTYEFEISKDNLEPTIPVQEKVIETELNIYKVYASDKTGFLSSEANITFDIYLKSTGEKYTSITTDSNGHASTTLPYGTYIVKQVNSTKDYEKVEDFEITVNEETDSTISKILSNAPITAKLRVTKVDKDTGNVITRSNVTFKIFSVDKNEYVCQTTDKTECEFTTNEDGIMVTPLPLEVGTYYLEEVDQVIDGYLWNSTSQEFKIGEDTYTTVDEVLGVVFDTKFPNTMVYGTVEVNKLGEEVELTENGYVYNKVNLKGVEIGLYANDDIYDTFGNLVYEKDTLVSTLITDEDGYAKVENLYLGKYYLQEIETVKGHVLDNTKYEFELKYKDQYTEVIEYAITLENHLPTGKLEFTKTDFSESKALPNTSIEIYTENDELVYTGTTDENGKIVIDRLPVGKYYILEKEAPDGYQLNTEKMYFEITEDGQVIKSTMKDEIVPVPNTGVSNIDYEIVGGIALAVIGVGLILYAKRKKN